MKPIDLTFNFIGVSVVDWQPAFDFFHHQVGMKAGRHAEFGNWAIFGGGWDAYQAGNRSAIFELFDNGRSVPSREWGLNQGIRPGLHVVELAATVQTLREKSVQVGDIVAQPWGKAAEIIAPEGIRFALCEIPDQPASDDLAQPYVGHVAIKCADFVAMQHFYGGILGFTQMASGENHAIYDQEDGHPLIVLERGGAPANFDPRNTHWKDDAVRAFPVFMSLMTPDIHAAVAHLRTANVTILREVISHADWGGTDIHIADPDGNALQVVQYG